MSNDQEMQENQNHPQPEPSSSSNSIRCAEPNESEQETFDIWNHFSREISIEGHWGATCNYCGDEYSADGDDAEYYLRWHLHEDHPEVLDDNDDAGEEGVGSGCNFFDEEGARRALALMIICHGYPISIVDHGGFRQFSHSLQPLFKLDRETVKKDILKIYHDEKSKTMTLLSKNESRVAITTDMWSCSDQDKHYLAIKAHFIDDSMTLLSRMLRFVYVPIPHTEDALSDVIVQCLKGWNLDTKLSTLTVDSCGASDATFECVLNKISPRSLILGGRLFHMRCCNHILNLIVKDALSVISDTVEKVRECVEFWTAAPDREEIFEETCKQLNIPYDKKLVLDCGTRWVSTFFMLNAAIPYKEVFHHLTQQQPQNMSLLSEDEWNIQQNMPLPSEDEWNMAKDICEKLELFYDLAKLFFGNVSPTPNVYFTKVCAVRLALRKWLSCSNAIIQQMASSMIAKFDNYWSGINEVMAVGAVLDPRYKMELLNFFFPRIYGENACHEIEKVKTVCEDLLKEYKNKSKEIETSSSSARAIVTNTSSVGGEENWESMFAKHLSKNTASKNTISELDQYLDADVLTRSLVKDLDILTWWKVNGFRYPTLQRIARDFLAIPTSTVVSESTFGTSGRFLTSHRSELHRKYVEALMCTQDWLGFSGMDFENDIDEDFENDIDEDFE